MSDTDARLQQADAASQKLLDYTREEWKVIKRSSVGSLALRPSGGGLSVANAVMGVTVVALILTLLTLRLHLDDYPNKHM